MLSLLARLRLAWRFLAAIRWAEEVRREADHLGLRHTEPPCARCRLLTSAELRVAETREAWLRAEMSDER